MKRERCWLSERANATCQRHVPTIHVLTIIARYNEFEDKLKFDYNLFENIDGIIRHSLFQILHEPNVQTS